jgi:hypothetical protein
MGMMGKEFLCQLVVGRTISISGVIENNKLVVNER